jgi:lipopolysaccharide transport system ATP-binding protein
MDSANIAFKVENISKRYRIGTKEKMHDSFGGAIFELIKSPIKNYRKYRSLYNFSDSNPDSRSNSHDVIWALNGVSFEVKQGEVVGIIGRNGAGKSTLLKILSKITHPTTGLAKIYGRVSSLLEVGTGFHPELTGRENVYLNGTILGMRKKEIDKKYDEIVEFSGVEKFIDTPVKRYSSGMKVRLAFSVAAHLEPEILVVDEVLAVGDAEFQKKCLHKMEDVGQTGRTVIFVSHNMSAITRLCQRAILLDKGRVVDEGPAHRVVNAYMNPEKKMAAISQWNDLKKAPGDDVIRLIALSVKTKDGQITDAVDVRDPVAIEMEYVVLESGHKIVPYFFFFDQEGRTIFGTLDQETKWQKNDRPKGHYRSKVWLPGNLLSPGLTVVNSYAMSIEPEIQHFRVADSLAFEVIDSFDGDSTRGYYNGPIRGAVRPALEWHTDHIGCQEI